MRRPMHGTLLSKLNTLFALRSQNQNGCIQAIKAILKKNDDHQDYLKKIVLPGSIKHDVLKKLDSMNINSYTLFENDEGLMEILAFREVMAREKL